MDSLSIYKYFDYQKFLRDYYEWRKEEDSYFSFRYISGKVGIDHALIVKIFSGQRHLTIDSIPVISKLCELTERQAQYFDLLVRYGRAKSDSDAKMYFDKLVSFSSITGRTIEAGHYEFYQKWYHTAIRELLNFYPFSGDYAALGSLLEPPISPADAKRSIALLEKLGFIKQDDKGLYHQADAFITTGESWKSLAIRQFQRESMDLAKAALENIEKERRDISTVSLSIDGDAIPKIRERVKQFHQDLLEIAKQSNKTDRVYQVNLQIFPFTKPYSPETTA